MKKPKLLLIGGPTAVGKTALSIHLAQKFSGEIINGDAMQVYRHLSIGTAKPSLAERQGVPHYLLDSREIDQTYSVSDFKKEATESFQTIRQKGHLPILVGGTGLYLESFLFNFDLGGEVAPHSEFRQDMEAIARDEGVQALHDRLAQQDPKAAQAIHPNNVKRVIRALEVGKFSDHLFSEQSQDHGHHQSSYDYLMIGLKTDRQLLYERINQRVDLMMAEGLLQEAHYLYDAHLDPHYQCLQSIAYKEFFPYFRGEESLDQAILTLKRNSRRYAKRQLTWLKHRMSEVSWYDLIQHPESLQTLEEEVDAFLHTGA